MDDLNYDLNEIVDRVAARIAARMQSKIGIQNIRGAAPRLLTVREAATYIGRTEQAIQHLIHRRELIVVRRGRHVHFDRADLDRWIEGNKI